LISEPNGNRATFEYGEYDQEIPRQYARSGAQGEIVDIAIKCWHVFGLKGYARVDLRVDKNENPFVIEVNANPCMSPDSGLSRQPRQRITFPLLFFSG